MTRISLGWDITAAKYIDYMIWLTERNLVDAMHRQDKIYMVEFKDAQDAIAFKLRFQI